MSVSCSPQHLYGFMAGIFYLKGVTADGRVILTGQAYRVHSATATKGAPKGRTFVENPASTKQVAATTSWDLMGHVRLPAGSGLGLLQ